MTSKAATPQEYINSLPADRKEAMNNLRKVIQKNIPKGFSEVMAYGMLGWVVPHKLYPAGYHCNPEQALPFVNIASQKNFIALYHMGVYANPQLLEWFTTEYKKRVPTKLDMGKSCIRFKKPEHIPFGLIGELMGKVTVQDWIDTYEKAFKASKKQPA